MKKLPSSLVIRAARFARVLSPARAERLLSGALFAYVDDREALRALLRELEGAEDHVALTERAMALQLAHDRKRKGPAMRGPYYEEGELVRHLERGDERLVRRHVQLMRSA
jgi:hypothetical protein